MPAIAPVPTPDHLLAIPNKLAPTGAACLSYAPALAATAGLAAFFAVSSLSLLVWLNRRYLLSVLDRLREHRAPSMVHRWPREHIFWKAQESRPPVPPKPLQRATVRRSRLQYPRTSRVEWRSAHPAFITNIVHPPFQAQTPVELPASPIEEYDSSWYIQHYTEPWQSSRYPEHI
ncbi:uncharacterized protein E0L32_008120 [Thyridium curvatum]|uniref:Uncharacterized protein n=1 Tax=Thyridium curvatum TaxID=1093900 RepID=A0A507AWV5_9PEZI|nr:uncharacterized protein E0L32_008120 [Thyridium curvatum]TPX10914.1 hypothetical protein E0L32_008120 [Thyridium curvatum]